MHLFLYVFYSSDYTEETETFLLYGLRTDLKRKTTFGRGQKPQYGLPQISRIFTDLTCAV